MPLRKGAEPFYMLYLLTLIKPCEVDTILTVCKTKFSGLQRNFSRSTS